MYYVRLGLLLLLAVFISTYSVHGLPANIAEIQRLISTYNVDGVPPNITQLQRLLQQLDQLKISSGPGGIDPAREKRCRVIYTQCLIAPDPDETTTQSSSSDPTTTLVPPGVTELRDDIVFTTPSPGIVVTSESDTYTTTGKPGSLLTPYGIPTSSTDVEDGFSTTLQPTDTEAGTTQQFVTTRSPKSRLEIGFTTETVVTKPEAPQTTEQPGVTDSATQGTPVTTGSARSEDISVTEETAPPTDTSVTTEQPESTDASRKSEPTGSTDGPEPTQFPDVTGIPFTTEKSESSTFVTTQQPGIAVTTASSTAQDLDPETLLKGTSSSRPDDDVATTSADTDVPTTTSRQETADITEAAHEASTQTPSAKSGLEPQVSGTTESVTQITSVPPAISSTEGSPLSPTTDASLSYETEIEILPGARGTTSQPDTDSQTTTLEPVTDSTGSPDIRSGKAIESGSDDNTLGTTKSSDKPVQTTTPASVRDLEIEVTTSADGIISETSAPTTTAKLEIDIDATTSPSLISMITTTIRSIFKSDETTEEALTTTTPDTDAPEGTTASVSDDSLAPTTPTPDDSKTPRTASTDSGSTITDSESFTTDSVQIEFTTSTVRPLPESRDLPVVTVSSILKPETNTKKESTESPLGDSSTASGAEPDVQPTTDSAVVETSAPTTSPSAEGRDLPLTTDSAKQTDRFDKTTEAPATPASIPDAQGTTTDSTASETLNPSKEQDSSEATLYSLVQPKETQTESPKRVGSTTLTPVQTEAAPDSQGVTTDSALVETTDSSTVSGPEGLELPVTTSSTILDDQSTDKDLPDVTTSAPIPTPEITSTTADSKLESTSAETTADPTLEGRDLPVIATSTEAADVATFATTSVTDRDMNIPETTSDSTSEQTDTSTTPYPAQGRDLPLTSSSSISETAVTEKQPDTVVTTVYSVADATGRTTTGTYSDTEYPTTSLPKLKPQGTPDVSTETVAPPTQSMFEVLATTLSSIFKSDVSETTTASSSEVPDAVTDSTPEETDATRTTAESAATGRELPATTSSTLLDSKTLPPSTVGSLDVTTDASRVETIAPSTGPPAEGRDIPVTTSSSILVPEATETTPSETATPDDVQPTTSRSTPSFTEAPTTSYPEPEDATDLPATTVATPREGKKIDILPVEAVTSTATSPTTTDSDILGTTSDEISVETTTTAKSLAEGRDLLATTASTSEEHKVTETGPPEATTPQIAPGSVTEKDALGFTTDSSAQETAAPTPQYSTEIPGIPVTTSASVLEAKVTTDSGLPETSTSKVPDDETQSTSYEPEKTEATTTSYSTEKDDLIVTTKATPRDGKTIDVAVVELVTSTPTTVAPTESSQGTTSEDSPTETAIPTTTASSEARDLPMTTVQPVPESKVSDSPDVETLTSSTTSTSDGLGITTDFSTGETESPTTRLSTEGRGLPVTTSSSILEPEVTESAPTETVTPKIDEASADDPDFTITSTPSPTKESMTTTSRSEARDLSDTTITQLPEAQTTASAGLEATTTAASITDSEATVTTSESTPKETEAPTTKYSVEGTDIPMTTVPSPREAKKLDSIQVETTTTPQPTTSSAAADAQEESTGSRTEESVATTMGYTERGRDLPVTTSSSTLEAKVTETAAPETTTSQTLPSATDKDVLGKATDFPTEPTDQTTTYPTEGRGLPVTTSSSVLEGKITEVASQDTTTSRTLDSITDRDTIVTTTDDKVAETEVPTTSYPGEGRYLPGTTSSSVLEAKVTEIATQETTTSKTLASVTERDTLSATTDDAVAETDVPTTSYPGQGRDLPVTTSSSVLESKTTETAPQETTTSKTFPAVTDSDIERTTTEGKAAETTDIPTTSYPSEGRELPVTTSSSVLETKATDKEPVETSPPTTQSIFDIVATTLSSIFKSDVSETTTSIPVTDSTASPRSDDSTTTGRQEPSEETTSKPASLVPEAPGISTLTDSLAEEPTTSRPEGSSSTEFASTSYPESTEKPELRQPKNLDGLKLPPTTMSPEFETTTGARDIDETEVPVTSATSPAVSNIKGTTESSTTEPEPVTTAQPQQQRGQTDLPTEAPILSTDSDAEASTTEGILAETSTPARERGEPVTTESSILDSSTDKESPSATTIAAPQLLVTTLSSTLDADLPDSTSSQPSGGTPEATTTQSTMQDDDTEILVTTDASQKPGQDYTTEQTTKRPEIIESTEAPSTLRPESPASNIILKSPETTTTRPSDDDQQQTTEILTSTLVPLDDLQPSNLESDPRQGKKLEDVTSRTTSSPILESTTASRDEAKTTVLTVESTVSSSETESVPEQTTPGITDSPGDGRDLSVTTLSSILKPPATDKVTSSDMETSTASEAETEAQATTLSDTPTEPEGQTTTLPEKARDILATTSSSVLGLEGKVTDSVPSETTTSKTDAEVPTTTTGYTSAEGEIPTTVPVPAGRYLPVSTPSSTLESKTTDIVPSETTTFSTGTDFPMTTESEQQDLPVTTSSSVLDAANATERASSEIPIPTTSAGADTQGTTLIFSYSTEEAKTTTPAEGRNLLVTTMSSVSEANVTEDLRPETTTIDPAETTTLKSMPEIKFTTGDNSLGETQAPTTASPESDQDQPTTTSSYSAQETTLESAGTTPPVLQDRSDLELTTLSSILEPESTTASAGESVVTPLTSPASTSEPVTEPEVQGTTEGSAQDSTTEPDTPGLDVTASRTSPASVETTTTKRFEDDPLAGETQTTTGVPLTHSQTERSDKADPRQGKTLEDVALEVTTLSSIVESTTAGLVPNETVVPVTSTPGVYATDSTTTSTGGETQPPTTALPTARRDQPTTVSPDLDANVTDTIAAGETTVPVTSTPGSLDTGVQETTTDSAVVGTSPHTTSAPAQGQDQQAGMTTTQASSVEANATDSLPAGTTTSFPSNIGLEITTQSSVLEPDVQETTTALPIIPSDILTMTISPRSDDEPDKPTTAGLEPGREATAGSATLIPEIATTTDTPTEAPITTTLFSILAPIFVDTRPAQRSENDSTSTVTTPSAAATTQKPVDETTEERQGKRLEDNAVTPATPRGDATDELLKIIARLNKKIEELEATQKLLTMNIDDLHKRVTEVEAGKNATTQDLLAGNPQHAVQEWKKFRKNCDTVGALQNATNTIVIDVLEKEAQPTVVLDFIHQLPNKDVQESAYSTVADTIGDSERLQERVYWKVLTPYCENAQTELGPNSTGTIKMRNLQNQVRLTAAQPIASSCHDIQAEMYEPAVATWLTMVRDIPDAPGQLETNMRKIITRTYNGTAENLPMTFQYILLLPINQGFFKQVAYSCIRREMRAHGHQYDASSNSRQTRSPELPSRDPYYSYSRY